MTTGCELPFLLPLSMLLCCNSVLTAADDLGTSGTNQAAAQIAGSVPRLHFHK
jgi:hypothetical protein